jgi:hypothetical protein
MKTVHRTKSVSVVDGQETIHETEQEEDSWFVEWGRRWTGIGGLVIALGAVIAWLFAYYKDVSAREFEAKKPFFEMQRLYYADAIKTVSKIATSESPSQPDMDDFWQLYFGRLAAVESKEVDAVMVILGRAVGHDRTKECQRKASLLLAHCVKQSWGDTWGVELGPAPELPCTAKLFASSLKIIDELCPKSSPTKG